MVSPSALIQHLDNKVEMLFQLKPQTIGRGGENEETAESGCNKRGKTDDGTKKEESLMQSQRALFNVL